ncbi:unnamed protein product [Echinostoma caproni]|uniref:Uncharacterized protein n=1 Tax=Echinostoma caproni TaxID=27848 RepID=A0A183A8K6_9TREM|nr:unnamed protein product [Echinostoma caproni]
MDRIHFKSSTDQRHRETSEDDHQVRTLSERPTEPHQSDALTQPIEAQGHEHEEEEPTIAFRRSILQANQIDEVLLKEESCSDPYLRDRV